MANCDGSEMEDSNEAYPAPFSLDGGLLSTLRGDNAGPAVRGSIISTEGVGVQKNNESSNPMVEAPSNTEPIAMVVEKNDAESSEDKQPTEETTRDVAILLTEMAEIASKEAPLLTPPSPSPPTLFRNLGDYPATPNATTAEPNPPPPPPMVSPMTPRFSALCTLTEKNYQQEIEHHNHANASETRARTVSISSPELFPHPSPPTPTSYRFESYSIGGNSLSSGQSLSPPESPHCAAVRPRFFSIGDAENVVYIPSSPSLLSSRRPLQPTMEGQVHGHKTPLKTTILKKKFSWKNYPELEAFLIANREEYLRHSTLNYTVQQKQYNNLLTERMLALAAESGYIFDEADFSFVTVRDRIRCYYKSYVQSLKKRGIVIGYAARKAGLVSETDLENSAATVGKIYLPSNYLP
eukprot:CAMPEP_0113568968 /NCGR_PEP_ID=MMETSP0015_2-20120614/24141_1 /TAXON_ID=2838 /ORGANISM="Odontella" /LENGTH=408 /DNA_ID=CAMNT_0000471563 /DNA_START=86 /DNA_END=1312 /DNA_ORIENTATION=- /assembly_acc=CAM_ASM_000160